MHDAEAAYDDTRHIFIVNKKRPEDEVNIHRFPARARDVFTKKGGSREKEWKSIKEA